MQSLEKYDLLTISLGSGTRNALIFGTFTTLVFPLLKRASKLEAQNVKEKASKRTGLQYWSATWHRFTRALGRNAMIPRENLQYTRCGSRTLHLGPARFGAAVPLATAAK